MVNLHATKPVISQLFLQDERPKPPAEEGLHVTGCCMTRLNGPTVLSRQVSPLAVLQVNDAVAEE